MKQTVTLNKTKTHRRALLEDTIHSFEWHNKHREMKHVDVTHQSAQKKKRYRKLPTMVST
ncbi:hypothetical protein NECAME_04964 [Necator americanus]|uniref:Uncharacterized protein n=1 Tax=Necator americanus TaxID=51031 RepID=W2SL76_NECAM|nr:hypothetical protein NECAME_04964 [Necator americanus]ETN70273.1 hypothetical protein NECAME_04964 [Necator americanus]